MRAFSRLLRRVVVRALYGTGLLMALADRRLRGRAVVLMYHRVLPAERQARSFSTPAIVVTPATFERHLRFLGRHFHVLDLEGFMACTRGEKPWPRRPCLITFDDGWYDNLEFALPIIKRHRLTAVLFAACSFIGTRETFWQERVARRLFTRWSQRDLPASVARRVAPAADVYAMTPESAREHIWQFIKEVKRQREVELPRLLAELAPDDQVDNAEDRFLGWDDLRHMQADGAFTIASHAMSHVPLTEMPPEQAGAELARSREELSARLGNNPPALAYPNGNHNQAVVELALQAGFQVAFTTIGGLMEPGSDPLRIRRLNISEQSVPDEATLLGRIAGIA